MNAARRNQFVQLIATAMSEMFDTEVKITVAGPQETDKKIAELHLEPMKQREVGANQSLGAGYGKVKGEPVPAPTKEKDREPIGYVVYRNGKLVPASFDEHRECLEEGIKRSAEANRMLQQLFGSFMPEMPSLPHFEVRPVFAD